MSLQLNELNTGKVVFLLLLCVVKIYATCGSIFNLPSTAYGTQAHDFLMLGDTIRAVMSAQELSSKFHKLDTEICYRPSSISCFVLVWLEKPYLKFLMKSHSNFFFCLYKCFWKLGKLILHIGLEGGSKVDIQKVTLDRKTWSQQVSAAVTVGKNVLCFEEYLEYLSSYCKTSCERASLFLLKKKGVSIPHLHLTFLNAQILFQLFCQDAALEI